MLPRLLSFNYGKYMADSIGDTVTIKKPYRAKATSGRTLSKSQIIDRSVEVKVNQRWHFALEYNDEEATLDIVDFGERYLKAGVEEIATHFDEEGAKELGLGMHIASGTGETPASGVLAVSGAITTKGCLLYTSPSPRGRQKSRMPSSA